jgi:transcriptional regulator with XRE-family HTH domain
MSNLQRTEARRDLALFVRERRGRMRPQDVGLDPGGRRRTPGLRREEVAQLVGVSATWYTWFEQGRDIRVSSRFLDGVSDALRLDAAERATLFKLAQRPSPAETARPRAVLPAPQAPAEDRNHRPPLTLVSARLVPAGAPPPDPEANRINQAIRRILASDNENKCVPLPVATPVPAAGTRRGFRWIIGMTVLGVLMLLLVGTVS